MSDDEYFASVINWVEPLLELFESRLEEETDEEVESDDAVLEEDRGVAHWARKALAGTIKEWGFWVLEAGLIDAFTENEEESRRGEWGELRGGGVGELEVPISAE